MKNPMSLSSLLLFSLLGLVSVMVRVGLCYGLIKIKKKLNCVFVISTIEFEVLRVHSNQESHCARLHSLETRYHSLETKKVDVISRPNIPA